MSSRALVAVAAAMLMALPAIAQDTSNIFITAQDADQHLAKDTLIGAKVYGKDGTIIGDIEDLILSDGNTVVGVIIGTGGFLGLVEKRIGIDLRALQTSDKDGRSIISLPVGHTDLVATPAYQRSLPKKSLLERVQEKTQELTDKTKVTTQDAYEKAKPKIDEAKEKAKELYDDAKEKVKELGEKAKPAIEDAKEQAKEAYEGAKEKVQEAVGGEPAPAEAPAPEASPAPETPAASGDVTSEQKYPPTDAYEGPGPDAPATPQP